MRERIVSKLQKNNLVAQSNKLIRGRYSLTKGELTLLVAMISLISPKDKEFPVFSVTVSELSKILNIDSKSAKREFKKISRRLANRSIEIENLDAWTIYPWMAFCRLEGDRIKAKFNDELQPFLLDLKKNGNFTQYRLGITTGLKSNYTIRIYQLLMEYSSKRISSFNFSLSDFRKMVLGDESKKYPLFKDFRKYILNVAKKELEIIDQDTGLYKSDLAFDLETRRTGRKISHLKFIIKKQKIAPVKQLKIEIPPEENPHQNTTEYKAMLLLAISEQHALAFMEKYGAEYIAEKLQVLAERQQIEDVISPSGLFINALKEDRKSEKLAKQKKEQERRAKEEEKRQLEQLQRKKEELAYEFGRVARKSFLESLNQIEESKILDEIKKQYEGDFFTLGEINKHGLSSMIISGEIIRRIPDFEGKRDTYIKNNLEK